jgi:hypothetical protein
MGEAEDPIADVAAANQARLRYLAEHGVQVPIDQVYATSLLEFLLGDRLDEAREYHEMRFAGLLDRSIGGLLQVAEHQQAAQEEQRAAQARASLLRGL